MNLDNKCKAALRASFEGTTDKCGCTLTPEENLLPEIRFKQIKEDLLKGDG